MDTRIEYEKLSPSEQKKYWEGLHSNPAWVSLCQALQAQADSLQQEIVFAPVTSVEDTYHLERQKGMLQGKLSVSVTAEAMYQTACVEIKEKSGDNGGDE